MKKMKTKIKNGRQVLDYADSLIGLNGGTTEDEKTELLVYRIDAVDSIEIYNPENFELAAKVYEITKTIAEKQGHRLILDNYGDNFHFDIGGIVETEEDINNILCTEYEKDIKLYEALKNSEKKVERRYAEKLLNKINYFNDTAKRNIKLEKILEGINID